MFKNNHKMKHRSFEVSEGAARAPHRAMFHAMGFTDEQIARPHISVASSWNEITKRLSKWRQPEPRYTQGALAKFAKLVSSVSEGAVCR